MIKRFLIILLLILSGVVFIGCEKKEDVYTVNIGYFPNVTHAQALVMKEQKLFEDKLEGDVSVNWLSFNAGPTEMEAFLGGAVDICYIGPIPAINGYIKSLGDLKVIAGASNGGFSLVVSCDSSIASAEDLANKIVAVPQFGGTQHLSLLNLLSSNGLTDVTNGGNVKIVASSNADIANLMNRGTIDAALVPEPWVSILEYNKDGKVLLNYDEMNNGNINSTAVVIVRKDFLEEHRDIVEKFIDAHVETTIFINKNIDESKIIIANQIYEVTQQSIDPKIINQACERLDITYKIPSESLMGFAQISIDKGFASEYPNAEIIDNSFVD